MTVKVVVEEHSVWAFSGRGEIGRRGGRGVVRRVGAREPFYRVRGGGGAGRPNADGNWAAGGGASLLPIRFDGGGETEGVSGE
jgi:hypothetical protein